MTIKTRPSIVHWIAALMIILVLAAMGWVPMIFLVARYFPVEQRLVASLWGALALVVMLSPLAFRSARAARWSVDLEGVESPVVGRIAFGDVASLHLGYPRQESMPMTVFQSAVAPGVRSYMEQTLILRLSDGRLLPLNLLSPTVRGGRIVMSKVEELLVGKRHANVIFSKAEIAALKTRPMNRIVTPKKT
jgi:hypothetical protein